jgi:hypothetical protein
MNPKLTSTLKMAAALWLKEAVDQHIDPHPDQQAELQRCLTSDGCDVGSCFTPAPTGSASRRSIIPRLTRSRSRNYTVISRFRATRQTPAARSNNMLGSCPRRLKARPPPRDISMTAQHHFTGGAAPRW